MRLKIFRKSGEQGVALVVTLIMLAVVTFLAVAYLAMSRREQSSIYTSSEQNRAQLMAESAFNHLKGKVIANILTYTNLGNYDLLVSTNFNNPHRADFRPGVRYPDAGYLTNVCLYDTNGAPISWSVDDLRVSLGNLQVSPVAPVFYSVLDNRSYSNDFRFYLDFNRNGKFDPTRTTNYGGTGMVQTLQWGDPQWIGVLENPNQPHSPSNQFIGRFAYVGVPIGKTLDINHIHNNTKRNTEALNELAYQRGQGVGSWEMNLAAFFRELNPLQWSNQGGQDSYAYFSSTNQYNRGAAFEDALEVLKYRYDDDYKLLVPLDSPTWIPGQSAYDDISRLIYKGEDLRLRRTDVLDRFGYDLSDTYADGPLQLTAFMQDWDNETNQHLKLAWVGSDNPKRFFDVQELVDDSKFSSSKGLDMIARLQGTYQSRSFTDEERYLTNDVAFYKLIGQMGADSLYTADKRIPLNYTTLASSGYTNFVPWTATTLTASNFFNTTADRLMREYYGKSLREIQIYPTNQYTAGVHQLFQLTANIYDAMTNQAPKGLQGPALPSVFRPVYRTQGSRVFLDSYEVVRDERDNWFRNGMFVRIVPSVSGVMAVRPDVTVSTFAGSADTEGKIRLNVIGMPWVIAARKGYPNFNEQELLTDIQLTRKIGMTRQNMASIFAIQDMWVQYILSVSNRLSFESWHPYSDNKYRFQRPLQVMVTNKVTSALWRNGRVVPVATATNMYGIPTRYSNYVSRVLTTNIMANDLRSWEEGTFKVMTSSNLTFVPSSIIETHQSGGAYYQTNAHGLVTLKPKNPSLFYQNANFLSGAPLYITYTNQITYIALDHENDWVIDYVSIEKTNLFNLTELVRGTGESSAAGDHDSSLSRLLWDPHFGIQRQIDICLGNQDDENTWLEFSGGIYEKAYQIQGFRQFCGMTNSLTAGGSSDTQGLYRQTPYNPTAHKLIIESLQVNDPLVHYHIGDYVNYTNIFSPLRSVQERQEEDPSNIGKVNNFYVPWGGNPDKDITGYRESVNQVGIKDPNVTTSDRWDFPTNWYGRPFAYPTIGWLGKVHRGTPWQTVYLKSDAVSSEIWSRWSGREDSHPTNDWRLMDIFTAAVNKNAARGLLSVNQTNSAAWAAVLGGASALTDTNTMVVIEPQTDTFQKIVEGINATRASLPKRAFSYQGEVLSSPSLSVRSPYLPQTVSSGINDAVMEWIPMQIMSLLREDKPAYLVYAYGQALAPAPGAVVLAPGQYRGMVTNYIVTAEYATKTVFRVEGDELNPKVVTDSFDVLPME